MNKFNLSCQRHVYALTLGALCALSTTAAAMAIGQPMSSYAHNTSLLLLQAKIRRISWVKQLRS